MTDRIPSALPVEAALRQAAETDDDELSRIIAESHRAELVLDHMDRIPHEERIEIINEKLATDPFLVTAIWNLATVSASNLGNPQTQLMMVRLGATVGDAIRQRVDNECGDDLVSAQAARMREEG